MKFPTTLAEARNFQEIVAALPDAVVDERPQIPLGRAIATMATVAGLAAPAFKPSHDISVANTAPAAPLITSHGETALSAPQSLGSSGVETSVQPTTPSTHGQAKKNDKSKSSKAGLQLPSPNQHIRIVVPGDTVSEVAVEEQTTVQAIVTDSHLPNPAEIEVGDKLVIKDHTTRTTETSTPTSIETGVQQDGTEVGVFHKQWDVPHGPDKPYETEADVQTFLDAVKELSKELAVSPDHLMAVFKFESAGTFDPAKQNMIEATGLIQFTKQTARGMGYTVEQLAAMTPIEQLKVVKEYFQSHIGKMHSLEDLYLVVFWPDAVGRGVDYVLPFSAKTYRNNRGFDSDKNGNITVGEITSRLRKEFEAVPLLMVVNKPQVQPDVPANKPTSAEKPAPQADNKLQADTHPTVKGEQAPDTIGNVRYFSQHDERWARVPYTIRNDSRQDISRSGCAPTTEAMILSTLLDRDVLPPEVAEWNIAHHFRTLNDGTKHDSFFVMANEYGLHTESLSEDEDAIRRVINDGGIVIVAARDPNALTPPTGGGHVFAIIGVTDDGRYIVVDPNSVKKSGMTWSFQEIMPPTKVVEGKTVSRSVIYGVTK